jgi:hypothetical protein
LRGTGWYGVSEKELKHAAANTAACMTKWKFETWDGTECYTDASGKEECEENVPKWRARVSLFKS